MGTEPAKELLKKWKLRSLTVEMATGHTLQHLVMLHEADKQANIQCLQIISALGEIETSVRSLRHDVDALIAHTSMPPPPPPPPKPKRGRPRKNAGKL